MNPNTKRELRRFTSTYAKAFEPVLVVVILIIFAIPILTVINLTPEIRSNKNANVLGVQDSKVLEIVSIGGSHEIIVNETVNNMDEGSKNYSAEVKPHKEGNFSKPIFTLTNNSDSEKNIRVSARTDQANNSKIGIIFRNTNYVLQSKTGELFFHEVTLQPGEVETLYLTVQTDTNIAFSEKVNLNLLSQ